MSYDINLYDKAFLREAIERDLGDFTAAPKFMTVLLDAIKQRLISFGYLLEHESKLCTEFIHPNKSWGLQATVFPGEVAFSIPYWDDAHSAITLAKDHARTLAKEFDLGLADHQTVRVRTVGKS